MSTIFYPPQWEDLDKAQILATMPEYLDSNQLFQLAEWSLARRDKSDAFYFYLQAIGRGNAHMGVLARAFELVFCETNYWLADAIAQEAVRRFPNEASTYFLLARVAATRGDEVDFKRKLKDAEEKGGAAQEIANVKKFSSHFFLAT